jgi:hypothetical protein
MAEIIYPETHPNIQNWCYWYGEYSIMLIRGNIENYVFNVIENYANTNNKKISLSISSCDGIEKEEEGTKICRYHLNILEIDVI